MAEEGGRSVRFERLAKVFDTSLEKCLDMWDMDAFLRHFHSATAEEAAILQEVYRQFAAFWKAGCHQEFEKIVQERNLREKLKEVDGDRTAQRNTPISPADFLRGVDVAARSQYRDELAKQLSQVRCSTAVSH